MQDLLLCSLYLRADKPGQEKEDAVGGELLTFMLAFPTLKTWTNVQECAAEHRCRVHQWRPCQPARPDHGRVQ